MLKQKLVASIFSSVSSKYDLMNNIMSLGLHKLWKQHMVSMIPQKGNLVIIDVAGGSGDITYEITKRNKTAKVILSDINMEMISVGKQKLIKQRNM